MSSRVSGFVLNVPEQQKFYESRHVKFVENYVFKNIVKKKEIESNLNQKFEILTENNESSETSLNKHSPVLESEGVSEEPNARSQTKKR